MNKGKSWIILAAAASLAGCEVGPDYHAPVTTMPAVYSTPPANADGTPAAAAGVAPPVDLARWWESFHDPELNSLVERAIQANLDVEIALDRLQESRAQEEVVTGMALPSGEFSGSIDRGTGSNVTSGRDAVPLNAAVNTQGLKQINKVLGFDAGWEIDLFGKYRRAIEAAHADAQAAAEVRNAVLITLISDVARAYVNLRTDQQELAIAQQNVQIDQQTTDLVQARFDRGITNEYDLALAKRQLATVQSAVAPQTAAIAAQERQLAVLLGRFPDELNGELQNPAALPEPPAQLQSGAPIQLLERRPDIRASERQLAAANARIGVATANLFPRIAITGGLGWQGQGLGVGPSINNFIWSAGPSAYFPLLDLGTLDSLIQVQNLQTLEMLANYRRTVLSAVEEVDDAITNDAAQRDRLRHLDDALVASQRAVDLALQRYERGLTDQLNVVDAESQLYDLQNQYARARQDVILQSIALYKALGGGWENYQTIPPLRTPLPAILATVKQVADAARPPATVKSANN